MQNRFKNTRFSLMIMLTTITIWFAADCAVFGLKEVGVEVGKGFGAQAQAQIIPSIPEIPAFPDIQSNGNTYHVDKDIGNDDNACTNIASPCETIQAGLNKMSAGDTLIISPGATPYVGEWDIVFTGDSSSWTTIKGEDGQTVEISLIDSGDAGSHGEFSVGETSRYIYIKNLVIEAGSAGWREIYIHDDVENVVFEDVEFDGNDINIYGFIIGETDISPGVTNIYLKNVMVHNTGQYGIIFRKPVTTVVLENVTVHTVPIKDAANDCIAGRSNQGDTYVLKDFYLKNVTVYDCGEQGLDLGVAEGITYIDGLTAYNCNYGAIKLWGNTVWIMNSLFYDNADIGHIEVKLMETAPHHDAAKIYLLHNTFGGGATTKRAVYTQKCSNVNTAIATDWWIYNNIFFSEHPSQESFFMLMPSSDHDVIEEGNNYYFGVSDHRAIGWRDMGVDGCSWGPYTESYTVSYMTDGTWNAGGVYAQFGNGEGNIARYIGDGNGLTNPGFVNLGNDDYYFLSGSFAVDAGIDVGITHDILGNPRDGKPDIGAYEYIPTDTAPPTLSNPSPTGTLSTNTTQTTISLTTNETATCRYSTTPNTAYASMTNTFSTTGGTTHSQIITGLSDGNSYNYYVRCIDEAGNPNTDDFNISFSIASSPSPTTYNILNFAQLIIDWLATAVSTADLNNDGVVNTRDLGIMMSSWEE